MRNVLIVPSLAHRHHLIVVYKTAFYSFYLPVALAMHMQGVTREDAFKAASDILIPLGEYFQVQDDYLDCYADPSVLGKIGTDILDNKCSWVINVALQHASPAQREVLDANYGRKDSACEAKVKQVFAELDVKGKFEQYEANSYQRITGMISQLDETSGLKKDVFTAFLNKIYKVREACRPACQSGHSSEARLTLCVLSAAFQVEEVERLVSNRTKANMLEMVFLVVVGVVRAWVLEKEKDD